MRILHLAERTEWNQGVQEGSYRRSTRGRSLADEGFIHASTASQVAGVVGRYYSDVDLDDYLLLVLDVPTVLESGAELRWETPPGAPTAFPHIYGPVVPAAVVAELSLHRDASGGVVLPDLAGFDVPE